jgi:hypothetical protein
VEAILTAIEMTGTVDRKHQLQLDGPLPITGPTRVRVIVLYPLAEDISETEWLQTADHNLTFAYLREATEDIYSVTDGKPFHDEQV